MTTLVLGAVPPGQPYFSTEGHPRWRPCMHRAEGDDGKPTSEPHLWFIPAPSAGLLCPACAAKRSYPTPRPSEDAMDWHGPRERSVAGPPAYSVAPPPMTPAEIEMAERGFASLRGPRPQAGEHDPAPKRPLPPGSADGSGAHSLEHLGTHSSTPQPAAEVNVEPELELDADQEREWAAAVDAWVGDDRQTIAAAPTAGDHQAITSTTPQPWRFGVPPCTGCGQHKAIMLVIAPASPGEKGFRICSGCYVWKTRSA